MEEDQDPGPVAGFRVDADGFSADGTQHVVQHTVFIVEYRVGDGLNQNEGNEVGQEHEALAGFLEPFDPHFVQHDGDAHLADHIQHHERHVVEHGVPRGTPQHAALDQVFKVFESHPGASENAVSIIELLERQDNTDHGGVIEQAYIQDHRQDHQE